MPGESRVATVDTAVSSSNAEFGTGTFGHVLSPDLEKQILRRQDIFSKNKNLMDSKAVRFAFGNGPWALLRSGVNLVTGEDTSSKAPSSCQQAKTHQLSIMKPDHKPPFMDNPISYGFTSKWGVRPVTGITGIEVNVRDTWGCIQEANVSLEIWSREDLDIIDALYFKPGMPVLLEFGHVIYVDNDGEVHNGDARSMVIPDSEFFKDDCQVSWVELEKKLEERRRKYNGNYEGLLGYVVNFSYSFRDNGSYAATIKIYTKGSVLEGIQIPRGVKDNRTGENNTNNNGTNESSGDPGTTSEIHNILDDVENSIRKLHTDHMTRFSDLHPEHYPDLSISLLGRKKSVRFWESGVIAWISLGDFLKILNKVIPEASQCVIQFNPDANYRYLTAKQFFSLSPETALKPQEPASPFQDECIRVEQYHQPTPEELRQQASHSGRPSADARIQTQTEFTSEGAMSDEPDRITNIWVNTQFIKDIVSAKIAGNNTSYNLLEVLKDVLAGIQKAFGNVNYFTWFVKQGDLNQGVPDIYEIIDRNNIDPVFASEAEGKLRFPTLKVSGIGTTVRNLSIESLVSSDTANEMSIAATAPGADQTLDANGSLVFWNERSRTRINYDFNPPSEETGSILHTDTGMERDEQPIGELGGIVFSKSEYETFVTRSKAIYSGSQGSTAKVGNVSDIQLTGESLFNRIIRKAGEDDPGYRQMGMIPLKVGMTMMGISRFVVGTSFKVEEPSPIPSKYKDWGYIVTKVSNKIDSSGWTTTLATQYYPIFDKKNLNELSFTPEVVQESVIPEIVNQEAIDNADGYREAFLATGIDYGMDNDFSHLCARYTGNWARAYVKGKDWIKHMSKAKQDVKVHGNVVSHIVPAEPVGGGPNSFGFQSMLVALGYKSSGQMTMTTEKIKSLVGGSRLVGRGIEIKEGDVIVYWNDSHVPGHACFYDGTRWCSDTDQRSAAVYNTSNLSQLFTIIIFSAPAPSSDWAKS